MMDRRSGHNVVDMTGKKIHPGETIVGGKGHKVDEGGIKGIEERMDKIKGISDELGKIEKEKSAMYGKKVESPSQIIVRMKAMTPMDAMKEANLVIARKGKYKNLTIEESQEILKKTDDHIFERDIKYDEFGEIIKPDPEDFAQGGRSGTGLNYLLGEDDQNSRVPYAAGSTQSDFDQYLKDREQRDKEEQKRKFKKDFEDWKKWKDTEGGTIDWAAEGGRIGFGLGGFNAARRAFLKLMGAGAATGVAAKSGLFSLLKSGKPVSKVLTQVPIKSGVDGMPAWFKPLVNQVIKKGDDVSEGFASAERQIVHHTSLPDSKTPILVTQELDTGNVIVDIGMGKHGFADGKFGQPVRLEYKASELIEPTIGKKGKIEGTKTKEEFWVEEAEFTGGHPENVKFEDSTFEKFGKHESNFDEVEAFAKGKTKKDARKVSESLQKEAEDLADHFSNYPKPDDFASGGRVPFGVGDWVKKRFHGYTKKGRDEFKKEWLDKKDLDMTVEEWNALPLKEKIKIKFREGNAQGGIAGMLGE